jgi:hypothetical protein
MRSHTLQRLCLAFLLATPPAYAQQPEVTATLSASTNAVYVNESLTVTLSLRHNTPIGREIIPSNFPPPETVATFERLAPRAPERWTLGRTVITEQRFAWRVVPRQAGPLVLAPRLTLTARGLGRIQVDPQPLTINVKPLPAAGRPEDFSGAIGSFNLHVEATPTEVAVGALVRVRMSVHGSGYLENSRPPVIAPAADFKRYDAELVSEKAGRSRHYEQTLIPQSTNAVTVPVVSFSYFDPSTGQYRRRVSGPTPLAYRAARRIEQATPVRTTAPAAQRRETRTPASPLVVTYWLFIVGVCAALAATRRRSAILGASILAMVAVIAFPSLHGWVQNGSGTPSTTTGDTTARLAPGHGAFELFDLTRGTRVQILETRGDWTLVAEGNKRGWMPRRMLASP